MQGQELQSFPEPQASPFRNSTLPRHYTFSSPLWKLVWSPLSLEFADGPFYEHCPASAAAGILSSVELLRVCRRILGDPQAGASPEMLRSVSAELVFARRITGTAEQTQMPCVIFGSFFLPPFTRCQSMDGIRDWQPNDTFLEAEGQAKPFWQEDCSCLPNFFQPSSASDTLGRLARQPDTCPDLAPQQVLCREDGRRCQAHLSPRSQPWRMLLCIDGHRLSSTSGSFLVLPGDPTRERLNLRPSACKTHLLPLQYG